MPPLSRINYFNSSLLTFLFFSVRLQAFPSCISSSEAFPSCISSSEASLQDSVGKSKGLAPSSVTVFPVHLYTCKLVGEWIGECVWCVCGLGVWCFHLSFLAFSFSFYISLPVCLSVHRFVSLLVSIYVLSFPCFCNTTEGSLLNVDKAL